MAGNRAAPHIVTSVGCLMWIRGEVLEPWPLGFLTREGMALIFCEGPMAGTTLILFVL